VLVIVGIISIDGQAIGSDSIEVYCSELFRLKESCARICSQCVQCASLFNSAAALCMCSLMQAMPIIQNCM